MADSESGRAFHFFIANFIIQLMCLWAGYKSFLALGQSDKAEMRQWLQFWVVYCAWCVLELFLDNILFYMPLYPEVKMAIVAGLIFGGGATKIYDPYLKAQIEKAEKMVKKQLKNSGTRVD
mmetsp:Transcript_37610/g.60367  ORF Transcript_37610/g.60367 Transcript_37610/m.60367 type:complete len:121 (-) Transcript_37610:371-733(-)